MRFRLRPPLTYTWNRNLKGLELKLRHVLQAAGGLPHLHLRARRQWVLRETNQKLMRLLLRIH